MREFYGLDKLVSKQTGIHARLRLRFRSKRIRLHPLSNITMNLKCILLLPVLGLLLSTTCKKDYYTGEEMVLLKAKLNNANESIRLGDTLKITFVLPSTLISETGVVTPVNSVQQALYNFTLYQVDTLQSDPATGRVLVTRIVSPNALVVSVGSMFSFSVGSVLVSTARAPFQSVLNIIPPTKGMYYIQTSKGALKVNSSYEAFLRVNLDVPDKHWTLADKHIPGYSTAPEIVRADEEGNGPYWFRVK